MDAPVPVFQICPISVADKARRQTATSSILPFHLRFVDCGFSPMKRLYVEFPKLEARVVFLSTPSTQWEIHQQPEIEARVGDQWVRVGTVEFHEVGNPIAVRVLEQRIR